MTGYCTLDADLNQCQYYDADNQTCEGGPEECGFCRKPDIVKTAEKPRAEKWFEKYLK